MTGSRGPRVEKLLHVTVKDTGIGIQKEDLNQLFKSYGRLEHAISNNSEGIGLGLTIVKALVIRNGGTIDVHSDGLNQGTSFKFTMKMDEEIQVQMTSQQRRTESEMSQMSRNLLSQISQQFNEDYAMSQSSYQKSRKNTGSVLFENNHEDAESSFWKRKRRLIYARQKTTQPNYIEPQQKGGTKFTNKFREFKIKDTKQDSNQNTDFEDGNIDTESDVSAFNLRKASVVCQNPEKLNLKPFSQNQNDDQRPQAAAGTGASMEIVSQRNFKHFSFEKTKDNTLDLEDTFKVDPVKNCTITQKRIQEMVQNQEALKRIHEITNQRLALKQIEEEKLKRIEESSRQNVGQNEEYMSREGQSRSASSEISPLSCVIVDDNPVCLMATRAVLQGHLNVQIDTFNSGEALIERLNKSPAPLYRFALLDYNLEHDQMNGPETAKRLLQIMQKQRNRALKANKKIQGKNSRLQIEAPNLPVVCCQSAYVGPEQIELCKQAGIQYVLPKPICPDELTKILEQNGIIQNAGTD